MIGQCCVAFEHIKASMAILTLRIHVTTTCRLYSCVFDCFGSSTTEWDYYERDVFRSQTVSTSPENSLNYIWLAKWLDLIQPQIIIIALYHWHIKAERMKIYAYKIQLLTCIYATLLQYMHFLSNSTLLWLQYSCIPLY